MLRYQHIDIIRSIWLGPEPPSNPYEYPIWIDTDDSVPYAYVFQLKKWVPLDEILGRKAVIYRFSTTVTWSTLIQDATDYTLAFRFPDLVIPESILYYFPHLDKSNIVEASLVVSNLATTQGFVKINYIPTNLSTIEYSINGQTTAIFQLVNIDALEIYAKGEKLQLDLRITYGLTESATPDYSSYF